MIRKKGLSLYACGISTLLTLAAPIGSYAASAAPPAPAGNRQLVLHADLSERIVDVQLGGESVETFAVGVGTASSPTPKGTYRISKIVWNPSWTPPKKRWARGKKPTPPGHPDNPMRIAKIFFRDPDYYIHGTTNALSIGEEGSHGCLRMTPGEIAQLARMIMEHGGQQRPAEWYESVGKQKGQTVVRLRKPVTIQIAP